MQIHRLGIISYIAARYRFQGLLSSWSKLRSSQTIPPDNMFDDQDLGFFANFLGVFIFALVIAYHYVMADPKYEGN
ncbi:uncharacterized protein LOC121266981 [Juglans microcarpa x Juglans regia]|nr:uncharacterized protein LOC121266981 [Juglans microcarpa x Juglans regia]